VLKVRNRPTTQVPEQADPVAPARFQRRLRARRRLIWRRVLAVLAAVALVAATVWLVFFSSALAVTGVEVTGTSVLSEAAVAAAADVQLGGPLATADLAAVQARVEDLAPVASAEVARAWPDHVSIAVTERQAVAVVSREGHWQGMDEDGVLFRTYPSRPAGLPQVDMRATTPIDVLAEAAAVVGALPAEVLRRVEYLDVGSIDSISLHLKGGSTVNWGSADESADKAEVLGVLLEHRARTYDVTAPGRPTIRR
jgi:cell division protein FtsQ